MSDRPIIFSAPMVRALLNGRKNMTRRLAWQAPRVAIQVGGGPVEPILVEALWQRVKPGDRLWVRENLKWSEFKNGWLYSSDEDEVTLDSDSPKLPEMVSWAHHRERDYCPSIHMPRWASRLTLTVAATKIERLQIISHKDAVAEGCEETRNRHGDRFTARYHFKKLWGSLHGTSAWAANPEVVAFAFSVSRHNIDRTPT